MGKKKKKTFDPDELMIAENFVPPQESEADRAYNRAVVTCSRIIRELDEEIQSMKRKEDASCTR